MDERRKEAELEGAQPRLGEAQNLAPGPLVPGDVQEVARFELLEERALVEKRREIAGRVQVRRVVERHTESVTVELLTERLVIEVVRGQGAVLLDGEPLAEGETREIVTYREEAVVTKRPVVSEEVRLLKRGVTNEERFDVSLGREVLRFQAVEQAEQAVDGVTLDERAVDQPLDQHLGGDATR